MGPPLGRAPRGFGKTLKKIREHPAVSDAFTDSDGTWCYLRAGWRYEIGEHIIVQDRASEVLRKLRYLSACECAECLEGLARRAKPA